jgi:PBSX family phage portal protein
MASQSRMVGVEDDLPEVEVRELEVKMGSVVNRTLLDPADDPFLKSAEELKTLGGLSPVFKRNTTRALQKVQQGTGGAKSKKNELSLITGYAMFDVVFPPYNLDYLAKLNEISPPHYAAIKAKVANIVALGFDFVESPKTKQLLNDTPEGDATAAKRKKIAKAKQEMLDWIDSCNQDDEFVETLIKVWTDYEATGNGYLEIGRTVTGDIGYIGHIPSIYMRLRKQRDGFVQIIADRAVFFRNFGQKNADPISNDPRPNEVIHIKKYSPSQNYYGVPDIIAAQQAIAGNEFSSRFNLDYFENKAVPRYVIVIKGGSLSANSERQILEFFQTNMKGKNHRTLYVPLPADTPDNKVSFDMKPVEAGTQDSSFNNYRKGNLSDILMAHRVPITKVGVAEGASLAVARDSDKTFKEQVCRPEQSILEKKLNKIIKEKTDIFLLKLNELTLTDEDTLSKMDERYLRWGVIVPNEVRARWGWTGISEGDKPVGVMQQAELAAKTQTDNAKLSAKAATDRAAATPAPAGGAQAAEQRTQANAGRVRDANRSATSPDKSGEGRATQGTGRAQA